MVDCMALLKPDAMTGHWEFTLGAERVKEIAEKLGFPFLAQNIRDTEWNEPAFDADDDVRARRREDRGDRPGVPLHADRQSALDDPELVVRHPRGGPARQCREGAAQRARSSWCCCRTTASTSTASSPARVDGIDVILTGHTHDALPDVVKVGKTLLVASGSHGKFVSRLDLDVRDGEVKDFRYQADPGVLRRDRAGRRDGREDRRASARRTRRCCGEVIGRTETLLYRRGNFNGTLDDVICDALLAGARRRDRAVARLPLGHIRCCRARPSRARTSTTPPRSPIRTPIA